MSVDPRIPDTEDERLPYHKVVGVGIAALLIFALATYWAVRILRDNADGRVTPRLGTEREIGREEIGIVDQRLFAIEKRGTARRREQAWRLRSYGWVDRANDRIHIPIDEAMEQLVAEQPR